MENHDINKEPDCEEDNSELEVVCAEKYQDFGMYNVHENEAAKHRAYQIE